MIIINATQHQATIEQTYDGVIDLSKSMREQIQMLLNFDQLPTAVDVVFRARKIALLIEIETDFIGAGKGEKFAMIGGAPFLMGPLCQALKDRGITPVFAFSQRESHEEHMPDGAVRKSSRFGHCPTTLFKPIFSLQLDIHSHPYHIVSRPFSIGYCQIHILVGGIVIMTYSVMHASCLNKVDFAKELRLQPPADQPIL